MWTPIELRIDAAGGGEEATLFLVPAAQGAGGTYDPSSTSVYTPPTPTQTTVKGILEVIPTSGREQSLKARFMFHTKVKIDGMTAGDLQVEVADLGRLTAVNVRERRFMGAIDGYSMDLHRGA